MDNSINNMKHIKKYPTQAELKELFDYDEGNISRPLIRKTGNKRYKGKRTGTFSAYYNVSICSQRYRLHRLVYIWHYGEIPKGAVINHYDGEGKNNPNMDNRKSNLQLASNRGNIAVGRNAVEYLGSWLQRHGSFAAGVDLSKYIEHKASSLYLGSFKTPMQASAAYAKAILLFEPYAYLGKIEETNPGIRETIMNAPLSDFITSANSLKLLTPYE